MVPLVLLLALCPLQQAAPGPAELVRSVVDLSEAARRMGRLEEALRILDLGEPLVAPTAAPVDRVRLGLQRARCRYYRASLAALGREEVAEELRSVASAAEPVGDARLLADARDQLGLALYGRDFRKTGQEEARQLFEQALSARQAAGDRRGVAESLFHVALTWENKKDPTPAELRRSRELHEKSLAVAEAGGFDVEASYAVRHIAGHMQEAGDLDGALAGFERSLRLREKAGYAIYIAPSLLAVGGAWKARGDVARARGYYERALEEAERLGALRFQEMARESLASLPPANSRETPR